MKKEKLIIGFVFMVFLFGTASATADDLKINERVKFTIDFFNSSNDASFTGASCNLTIRNENYTILVDEAAMTEISRGEYNYTYTPTLAQEYTWKARCQANGAGGRAGGVFKVYANDIHGKLDNNVAQQKNLTDGIVVLTSTTETQIDDILTDTGDLQTNQGDWTTADLTGVCYDSNLSQGIITLTATTETQIDNIEGDTNELQLAQGDWATAVGFSTHSETDVNDTLTAAHGAGAWTTGASGDCADNTTLTAVFVKIDEQNQSVHDKIEEINDSLMILLPNATASQVQIPPTQAVVSLEFAGGNITDVYFYVELAHIFGNDPPENDEDMKDQYQKKILFNILLRSNMTQANVTFWVKKAGTPAGNFTVNINGENVSVFTADSFTTDYVQYNVEFGTGNITSSFVDIRFLGEDAWNNANKVVIGSGEIASTNSFGSTDAGATWAHTLNELGVGLWITSNQKSIADEINKDVRVVSIQDIQAGCPGEIVVGRISVRDFKGQSVIADSVDYVCEIEVFNETNSSKFEVEGAAFSARLSSSGREFYAVWTNTSEAILGATYEFECKINWTVGSEKSALDTDDSFIFNKDCSINGSTTENIKDINGSITTTIIDMNGTLVTLIQDTNGSIHLKIDEQNDSVQAYGDSNWATATGFATSNELIAVNQSLTDLIIASISGLANITALDVWAYATRALTTPIATDSNQNMTGISDTADVSGLLTTAQFNLNLSQLIDYGDTVWITAVGFSTHSAANVWAVVTRALSTPIATDSNQNMSGIAATGFETESTALSRYDNLTTQINDVNNTAAENTTIELADAQIKDIANQVWNETLLRNDTIVNGTAFNHTINAGRMLNETWEQETFSYGGIN